jgi:protein SCO1
MRRGRAWLTARHAAAALTIALNAGPGAELAFGHSTTASARLSKIGPAPEFALTAADGARVTLADLRGKVVAVTFIYASCADTCPLLTAKLVGVQKRLGPADAARTRFIAVTVDPGRDTPEVLRDYGTGHGARPPAWAFLTGTPQEIRDVTHRYGVYVKAGPGGAVDHTFLTSLVDRDGVLRVQYLGVRFDPAEFLRDVRSLHAERPR